MKCPYCSSNKDYEVIGNHWSLSSDCDGPVLDEQQRQIVMGLMLTGASPRSDTANFRLSVHTKSKEFAEWLDSELGVMSASIRKIEREKESDFAKDHGYTDSEMYEYNTRTCQAITDIKDANFEDLNWLAWKVVFARQGVYNLGWNSYLQIQTGRSPLSKEEFATLLNDSFGSDLGFYPQKSAIRTDSEESAEKFMRWIGYPIPGMEWRWDPHARKEDQE